VQNEAAEEIEVAFPRLPLQRLASVRVTSLPAHLEPRGAEIDVLVVVLTLDRRGQQPMTHPQTHQSPWKMAKTSGWPI
jgi:hypothetical protein